MEDAVNKLPKTPAATPETKAKKGKKVVVSKTPIPLPFTYFPRRKLLQSFLTLRKTLWSPKLR